MTDRSWSFYERRMDRWLDMGLPDSVAMHQASWERRKAFVRMRQQGMTYRAIGEAVDLSLERVRQIVHKDERAERADHDTPPILLYLTRWGELYDLTRSPHTMQMIEWMAGGPKPTIKRRHRMFAKQRPPFNPTEADMAAIWDAFKDTDQP